MPGPTSAQDNAVAANQIIDTVKSITTVAPPTTIGEVEKAAVEIIGDQVKALNDARAQAERIMNNPQNAFLPALHSKDARKPSRVLNPSPPCPSQPMTCNPTNVKAEDVLLGKAKAFINECAVGIATSKDVSGADLTPVFEVACSQSNGQWRYTIKSQTVMRPGYTKSPTIPVGQTGNYLYNGYGFIEFCQACIPKGR